jgi:16S rRNA C967 or C1407 C5-methylase (RsmB/RsmF family)
MKKLLGQEEYEAYLRSFDEERLYGLRVNTLKITPEKFMEMTNTKSVDKTAFDIALFQFATLDLGIAKIDFEITWFENFIKTQGVLDE